MCKKSVCALCMWYMSSSFHVFLFSASSIMVKSSFARFSPFARGRIVGQAEAGASRAKIRKTVRKKDGRKANLKAIGAVLVRG